MVPYDPTVAASQPVKRARPSSSPADAGAMVPYDASKLAADDTEPIDAVPLKAVAPRRKRPRLPLVRPLANPEEPSFLREHILPRLGLRKQLQVHFIHTKRVTDTDLEAHQNRFRIPTEGAVQRLRPIMTAEELDAANLLHDPAAAASPESGTEEEEEEEEEEGERLAAEQGEKKKRRRKKRKGKVHGGLPVRLVDLAAGVSDSLLLTRWTSSHGTIVKGGGYMSYVRRCSFKEHDVVDIWAFKQREFRLMGTPTTGFSRFAVSPNAHGKGAKAHGKAFAVSRLTVKPSRQKTYRQRGLCREPYITLSANLCREPENPFGKPNLTMTARNGVSGARTDICREPKERLTAKERSHGKWATFAVSPTARGPPGNELRRLPGSLFAVSQGPGSRQTGPFAVSHCPGSRQTGHLLTAKNAT
ncbi:hypothetical protein HU200_008272 [Digitaria exilis]|uniref:Uncharacterized protein n=1 Tax=Digitaria exilis TaxID=1010633 RepID=A0A835KQI0_9POAL|nr:hypothetical protein HU200_008272 [Digitaria exilis]